MCVVFHVLELVRFRTRDVALLNKINIATNVEDFVGYSHKCVILTFD